MTGISDLSVKVSVEIDVDVGSTFSMWIILTECMHSAKTAFPLDTQETGRLKSAFLSSKCFAVSLFLTQGACPFFCSLFSACSVTQLCVCVCSV